MFLILTFCSILPAYFSLFWLSETLSYGGSVHSEDVIMPIVGILSFIFSLSGFVVLKKPIFSKFLLFLTCTLVFITWLWMFMIFSVAGM